MSAIDRPREAHCSVEFRAKRGQTHERLMRIYGTLLARFGHAGWWPGETPFEVAVGAVLTQNTAWRNVEKAIAVLKQARLLDCARLSAISVDALAPHLRSAGYFRVKARRLKNLVAWIAQTCDGDLARLAPHSLHDLRQSLLEVSGVGEETADSILLYAVGHATFVVDAYTRRAFHRLGFVSASATYADTKRLFEESLQRDAALYNDFHAQIVRLGHAYCRPTPRCDTCPLGGRDS